MAGVALGVVMPGSGKQSGGLEWRRGGRFGRGNEG